MKIESRPFLPHPCGKLTIQTKASSQVNLPVGVPFMRSSLRRVIDLIPVFDDDGHDEVEGSGDDGGLNYMEITDEGDAWEGEKVGLVGKGTSSKNTGDNLSVWMRIEIVRESNKSETIAPSPKGKGKQLASPNSSRWSYRIIIRHKHGVWIETCSTTNAVDATLFDSPSFDLNFGRDSVSLVYSQGRGLLEIVPPFSLQALVQSHANQSGSDFSEQGRLKVVFPLLDDITERDMEIKYQTVPFPQGSWSVSYDQPPNSADASPIVGRARGTLTSPTSGRITTTPGSSSTAAPVAFTAASSVGPSSSGGSSEPRSKSRRISLTDTSPQDKRQYEIITRIKLESKDFLNKTPTSKQLSQRILMIQQDLMKILQVSLRSLGNYDGLASLEVEASSFCYVLGCNSFYVKWISTFDFGEQTHISTTANGSGGKLYLPGYMEVFHDYRTAYTGGSSSSWQGKSGVSVPTTPSSIGTSRSATPRSSSRLGYPHA